MNEEQELAALQAKAQERALEQADAASKQVFLVIESTDSIPCEKQTEGAATAYTANPENWTPLNFNDVPEWVKTPEHIQMLEAGQAICQLPSMGGRWYRAYEVEQGAEDEEELPLAAQVH